MKLALVVLGGSLVLAGCASGPKEEDHAAHHPPEATAAATAPTSGQMDSMMKSMQDMHEKMMAAKTPEERNALMAEQMKLMQSGMSMMNGMGPATMMGGKPADMAARASMMEQRMDMMQAMMQMMMDRTAVMPPVK